MKKVFLNIAIVVCLGVFIFSGYKLYGYYSDQSASSSEFDELREIVKTVDTDAGDDFDDSHLWELHEMNSDFVGWLTVDGTDIDYPVMFTPDDPEYYLKRSFSKESNSHGTLFASGDSILSPPSDNIVIYGHHMKDGSMFAGLMNFEDQNFYNEHSTLTFDTLYDHGTYQIVSVFKSQVYTGSTEFKYYSYINFESEEEFDDFFEQINSLTLYDTGNSAEYGDQLITLSTCEYSKQNSRMIVIAKKLAE